MNKGFGKGFDNSGNFGRLNLDSLPRRIVRNCGESVQDAARISNRSERSLDVSATIRGFAQQSLAGSRGVRYGQRCISAKLGNRPLFFVLDCIAERPNENSFRPERLSDVKRQTAAFPGREQQVTADESYKTSDDRIKNSK